LLEQKQCRSHANNYNNKKHVRTQNTCSKISS
jgi:hypothetical protein